MVVISDTSVISNLLQIDHLHLLPTLFGQAKIPPAVHRELNQMSGAYRFVLAEHPWLEVKPLADYDLATQLQTQLDPGESEAIALAEELSADVLLIDEAKGRKIAQQRGMAITGLLGVLLSAKDQGHIHTLSPLMDRLIQEANFRISAALYRLIEEEAGE
jgi:hypothetical protein